MGVSVCLSVCALRRPGKLRPKSHQLEHAPWATHSGLPTTLRRIVYKNDVVSSAPNFMLGGHLQGVS